MSTVSFDSSIDSDSIPLKHPITSATGKTITHVSLRRPQVVDMLAARRASGEAGDQTATLIANLSCLAPEDIDELDAADFRALSNAVFGTEKKTPKAKPGEPIELLYPIEKGGDLVLSGLTLRRPKVKDLLAAEAAANGDDAAEECHLLAALASVSIETIHKLDYADFRRLKEVYASFLK